MKTNITLLSIACICASLISCQDVPDVQSNIPEVVGLAVEDVDAESCTLRAEVSGSEYITVNFEYSVDSDFQNSRRAYGYYHDPHYIATIKDLKPGTQYYFRCIVINKGNEYQEFKSFPETFTTDTRYRQSIYWYQKTEYYLNDQEIKLNATASSGLPVSYRVTEGNNIVSVESDWLLIKSNGTAVVEAYQDGNDLYYPANPVSKMFEIMDNKLIITDVYVDDWEYGGTSNSEVEI